MGEARFVFSLSLQLHGADIYQTQPQLKQKETHNKHQYCLPKQYPKKTPNLKLK